MSVRKRPASQGGGWEIDIGVRGKRYRRTVKGNLSQRRVETLEKDWRYALESGRDPFAEPEPEPVGPELRTWGELAARWWERRGKDRDDAATIEGHIERLSDGIGDHTPLESITTATFEALLQPWLTTPTVVRLRNGKTRVAPPPGPVTINNRLRIARTIWLRATDVWHAECPPLARIAWGELWLTEPDRDPLAHYQAPEVRAAILDQLARTAPHAHHAVLIAEETGLRISSVLSLDWERIDLEARVYRVLGKGRGGGRWLVKPISSRLAAIFHAIGPQEAGPVIAYARPTKKDKPKREAEAVGSIARAVNNARAKCGLPAFTVKALRHSSAIEVLAAGGTISDAQALLDHRDPRLTHQHYGRLDVDAVRRIMEQRGAAIATREPKGAEKMLKNQS